MLSHKKIRTRVAGTFEHNLTIFSEIFIYSHGTQSLYSDAIQKKRKRIKLWHVAHNYGTLMQLIN